VLGLGRRSRWPSLRINVAPPAHRPTASAHALGLIEAIEGAFGCEVDYAMLVKIYGNEAPSDSRYSPPECIACQQAVVNGWPNKAYISTSHVERQNLTMRMPMRCFTRLTNGFSKKIENHIAHTAIHFMHYNFCQVHSSIRVTPAMQAGLADHVWKVEEIVALLGAESARIAA
jgi:hypothetical protein